jgi:hypothetical protein
MLLVFAFIRNRRNRDGWRHSRDPGTRHLSEAIVLHGLRPGDRVEDAWQRVNGTGTGCMSSVSSHPCVAWMP